MILALDIIMVIAGILMSIFVLLHKGKGGGLSSLFGGGVQSNLSGSTVVECLHAKVPATSLYIVQGTRNDARLSEAVAIANSRTIPILEIPRHGPAL